jgi:hypothetical protein
MDHEGLRKTIPTNPESRWPSHLGTALREAEQIRIKPASNH